MNIFSKIICIILTVFFLLIFSNNVYAARPDRTPPTITITSPQNITYNTNLIPLTFSINEPTSWIGYSLDNQPNITISGSITLSNLSDSTHNVIVYANDTSGNMGVSNGIFFTIDTIPPTINFISFVPNSIITTKNYVLINITSNEILSSATLEWNGINESMSGSGTNWFSNKTNLEGNYTFRVFVSDIAGNSNLTSLLWVKIILFPILEQKQTLICLTNSTNFTSCFNSYFDDFDTDKFLLDSFENLKVTNKTGCSSFLNCLQSTQASSSTNFFDSENLLVGAVILGSPINTKEFDGLVYRIEEANVSGFNRFIDDWFFNISVPVGLSVIDLKQINIVFTGTNFDSENYSISIFNFSSGNYIQLPNQLYPAGGSSFPVVNMLDSTSINLTNFIQNNQIKLRVTDTINDSAGGLNWLQYDLFRVDYLYPTPSLTHKIFPQSLLPNHTFNIRISYGFVGTSSGGISLQKSLDNINFIGIRVADSGITLLGQPWVDTIELTNFTSPVYLRWIITGNPGGSELDFFNVSINLEDKEDVNPNFNIFNLKTNPQSPANHMLQATYNFNSSILQLEDFPIFEFNSVNYSVNNNFTLKKLANRNLNFTKIDIQCSSFQDTWDCFSHPNLINTLDVLISNSTPASFPPSFISKTGNNFISANSSQSFTYEINNFDAGSLQLSFAIASVRRAWDRIRITYQIFNFGSNSFDLLNTTTKNPFYGDSNQPRGNVACTTFYQAIPIQSANLQNGKVRLRINMEEIDNDASDNTGVVGGDSFNCDGEIYTIGEKIPVTFGSATFGALIWARVYYKEFYTYFNNLLPGFYNYKWISGNTATNLSQYTVLSNAPLIVINSPENITYYKINIPLNFTIDKPVSNINYKLNNQPDVAISGNTTLKITKIGLHNISVSATDMSNNTGISNLVNFSSCVGDANRDRIIDISDASMLAIAYGSDSSNSTGKWNPDSDFDEDGKITILDAAVIAINYGKNC